jgi:hypothetical protein
MVNRFGAEDKYLLCADGQVHISTYRYIRVRACTEAVHNMNFFTYQYVPVRRRMYLFELVCTNVFMCQVRRARADLDSLSMD